MAYIVFTAGAFAGQQLELPETGLSIGRGEDSDLTIEDSLVSTRHAELRPAEEGWFLADLASSNGTVLNGELTAEPVLLTDGDLVEIGETAFRFHASAPQEIEEPPSAPAAAPSPPSSSAAAAADREEIALVKQMSENTRAIRREVGKTIVGQVEVLDQILMCMLAGGHALLIGLPGMAKTLMVRTIASVLDLKFKRVQFTPDLMPTDITGTEIIETNRETGEKEFRFVKGPIFCNLLLADEINRTPPKTQASLLEAMQEQMVTAGNVSYTLERPFFVLATQNPIEQEGTYPLPEAQLDRFMFNIWVDYPKADEEEQIVSSTTMGAQSSPKRVLSREDVIQLQDVVHKIPVSQHVIKFAIRLVRATRPGDPEAPEITKTNVATGAGPRAGQYLVLAAKARAVLEGRIHVSCNDIREAAIPVLRHRILTNFTADSEGLTSMDIVKELLDRIDEPDEDAYPS